jgi:hypothetical protein
MRYACPLILAVFPALAQPGLTVYNQQFAIVRERIPLNLQAGDNRIEFANATAHLEPESVILRDPAGKRTLAVLEQNYRADPIALEALLAAYEGRTIEFQVRYPDRVETVSGKVIRAGYTPRPPGPGYYYQQGPPRGAVPSPPIIEVDGKLRFDLPGTPLFPALGAGAQLKPAISWIVRTDRAGPLEAELSYASGGFNWEADYNMVQGAGGTVDMTGWVTIENRSGRSFEKAAVKLMAGDVNKVVRQAGPMAGVVGGIAGGGPMGAPGAPPVTEKSFDEYHLYTLERPVTLLDKESKQVEFLRAEGVKAEVLYVYDGAQIDWNRYRHAPMDQLRMDPGFGSQSHNKVWVMREFVNSDANRLGMPLPKGRVRFYRRDTDGRLEFTGEDVIDHTPRDERVRVFTGAAFDIVGERRRTSFRMDHQRQAAEETFEIKVRNRKKEPVEVVVVERLFRGSGWDIPVSSQPPVKTDAHTVEFRTPLGPGEEKTVTYAVHYRW